MNKVSRFQILDEDVCILFCADAVEKKYVSVFSQTSAMGKIVRQIELSEQPVKKKDLEFKT